MKNIFIIVQARMTSTRLPKKVMLPLFNNMSVLEIFLKRLNKYKENIIVATTNDNSSKSIVQLCKNLNINYYKGSMDNVLERYYKCAKNFGANKDDIIVRICSDSPCIDPDILAQVIDFYNNNSFDYVINDTLNGTPKGLNIEVFSFEKLEYGYLNAVDNFDKEHVTPYIKRNFNVGNFINDFNNGEYSLTLDTEEDYKYLKKLFKNLGKINFNYKELIKGVKEI
ncbi:MAG: glycosyltransferase family protein [Campylobacterota bacterium]|nr:glycosyltransferase family protein [Campylobacterota bacterium]